MQATIEFKKNIKYLYGILQSNHTVCHPVRIQAGIFPCCYLILCLDPFRMTNLWKIIYDNNK
jgi:hypothetical protein